MSKNIEITFGNSTESSAPPADVMQQNFGYAQRAPPPSYEESIRMSTAAQQQPFAHIPNNIPNHVANVYPGFGVQQYPLVPQPLVQQPPQYVYPNVSGLQPIPTYMPVRNDGKPHVLELAKGAAVRTTANSSISISPPPPGIAPTPAQLAVMNGQSVLVKPKKRGFF